MTQNSNVHKQKPYTYGDMRRLRLRFYHKKLSPAEDMKYIYSINWLKNLIDTGQVNNKQLKDEANDFIKSIIEMQSYKNLRDKADKILQDVEKFKTSGNFKKLKDIFCNDKNCELLKIFEPNIYKWGCEFSLSPEDKILKYLESSFNFEGFFHTTEFDNFIKIMKLGKLCSRRYLQENNISFNDIANQDVLRKQKNEPDYVRFYFRPKTPTNHENEGIQDLKNLKDYHSPNPVIMIFDSSIAENNDCKYKQNSKTVETLMSSLIAFEKWELVFDKRDPSELGNNWKELKKYRMAECLYPSFIETDKIKRIIYRSDCDKMRAIKELGNDDRFEVNSDYFFNHRLYVKNYEIKQVNQTESIIKVDYNIGQVLSEKNINPQTDYNHEYIFYNGDNIVYKTPNLSFTNNFTSSTCIINNTIEWNEMCYKINDIECIRISKK